MQNVHVKTFVQNTHTKTGNVHV